MTPEVSKQIANLFGQVAVSELPQDIGPQLSGEYLLYKYKTPTSTNVDTTVYRIDACDLYYYLCRNVFAFLVEQKQNDIELHPGDFLDKNDTPVIMGRKLLGRVPNWIGHAKPAGTGKNISERWFEHFQYYYFDNLNNRLPTMLLKYEDKGPATGVEVITPKTYDIVIWIDSSGSMDAEIANLKTKASELCDKLLEPTKNLPSDKQNRIAFVQYNGSSYFDQRPLFNASNRLTSIRSEIQNQIDNLSIVDGDESLWGLWNLAHLSAPPGYGGKSVNATARLNWRSNSEKIMIAITDEPMDVYVSATKRFAIPYPPGYDLSNLTFAKNIYTSATSECPAEYVTERYTEPTNLFTGTLQYNAGNVDDKLENAVWYHPSVNYHQQQYYKRWEQGTPELRYFCKNPNCETYRNGHQQIRRTSNNTCPVCGGTDLMYVYFYLCRNASCQNHNKAFMGRYVNSPTMVCPKCKQTADRQPTKWLSLGEWKKNFPYHDLSSDEIMQKWADGLNAQNIKFYFINTCMDTVSAADYQRYFLSCEAYTQAVKKDLVSRVYAGGGSYNCSPSNLVNCLKDILESNFDYVFTPHAIPWSNNMWNTHLIKANGEKDLSVQVLPYVVKNDRYKALYVPTTAVVRRTGGSPTSASNFIWSRFDRRNYIRIVTGGWDKADDNDWEWTDEKAGMETAIQPNEPSREGNDGDATPPEIPQIDQTMGDIDQTIKAISEFLDDVEDSIKPMVHKGKVIFTASTEENPLNSSWRNVLNNKTDCFVLCGTSAITGENNNAVPGIPSHHHNTVISGKDNFKETDVVPISNISVVGRPEGETVGGVAKVDCAERISGTAGGKVEDTTQKLASTSIVLPSKTGAYCGTVVYSNYKVNAAPKTHNNMPLYYKMRAFVYG